MLALLEQMPPRRRGMGGRLLDRIFPIRPTVHDQKIQGVDTILVKACPRADGTFPWEALERAAGGCQWLLPEGLEPPEDFPVTEALPLQRALTLELARYLLTQTRIPPAGRSVALLDRQGLGRDALWELAPLAGALWVWSDAPAQWQNLEEELMAQWGTPLQLVDTPQSLVASNCLLALALDGWEGPALPPFTCPILTPQPLLFTGRCQQVVSPQPKVPEDLEAQLPPGISGTRFAQAVYGQTGSLPWEIVPVGGICGRSAVSAARILSYIG